MLSVLAESVLKLKLLSRFGEDGNGEGGGLKGSECSVNNGTGLTSTASLRNGRSNCHHSTMYRKIFLFVCLCIVHAKHKVIVQLSKLIDSDSLSAYHFPKRPTLYFCL